MAVIPNQMNVVVTWPVESSPIKKVNSSQLNLESWESRQSLFFHVSHTFWVYLLSDLVLLQIPLCIPHLVNYCSLLSSNPPPPFHSVTVDTWHLETTCASPTKCWQSGDHQWRWKNRLAYSGLLCTTERWGTHWFLWVVFFMTMYLIILWQNRLKNTPHCFCMSKLLISKYRLYFICIPYFLTRI